MATTKPKQDIVESLDRILSDIIYTDELPVSSSEGRMAVIESKNQYWRFIDGKWQEFKAYPLAL